jgi:HK97 family phage major capsid protein
MWETKTASHDATKQGSTMSIATAKALREERARLWEAQKALLAAAEGELSNESRSEFDRIEARMGQIAEDVRRIEAHEANQRDMVATQGRIAEAEGIRSQDVEHPEEKAISYADAFRSWALYGPNRLTPEQRMVLETRSPQSTSATAGGYTIAQEFSGELEQALKAWGGVRQAARVMATDTGALMPWPTVNDTSNKGRLLGENSQVQAGPMTFGVVNFSAFKFSSDSVLVSEELLQDSAFDLGAFIGEALGVRLGRIQNEYFTTGTGTSQPQGVVTASTVGLTTGTDAVAWEDLVQLIHSVDPAYRASPSTRFMFSDATLSALKQLSDGENRPLWVPGISSGEPDRVFGYQYTINQDMAGIEAGEKAILFGDFSKFVVRDVRGFTLLRLVERYADFHQVGFLAFTRNDSRLLDAGTGPIKALVVGGS